MAQKEAAGRQYAEASRRTVGAEANILRREADLDMARLNLSYTVLTAPYDGYIGRRTLEPGQFVQAGQTVSYLVRNRDKYITANYKETQIAHIHIGQEVVVKVDAFPGRPVPGPRDGHFGGDRLEIRTGPDRQFGRKLREGAAAHPCPHRPRRHFGRGDGPAAGRHDGRNRSPPPMITAAALELPVRRWVPDRLAVAGLFSVLLPVTMLNGSYTGSMLEVSNTLGSNAEDITMGYYAASAGMAIALPHRARRSSARSPPKCCCWRT